jgi:hypothetical protein
MEHALDAYLLPPLINIVSGYLDKRPLIHALRNLHTKYEEVDIDGNIVVVYCLTHRLGYANIRYRMGDRLRPGFVKVIVTCEEAIADWLCNEGIGWSLVSDLNQCVTALPDHRSRIIAHMKEAFWRAVADAQKTEIVNQ